MTRTLVLFDGLGGNNDKLLSALAALYAEPANAAYFHCVFAALDQVRERFAAEATPAPVHLLNLRQWLEKPGTVPADPLCNSIAAGICVVVHQLCRLQPARRLGAGPVVAALGYSIGLQAALVCGLRLRRLDAFLDAVTWSIRLVASSLIRAHHLTAEHSASPASPMALLSGTSRQDVQEAVEAYNKVRPQALTVGLVNSRSVQVVSGPAPDLLDFHRVHGPELIRTGATWSFLANTIPFHSPALAEAVRQVHADRAFIGGSPTGPDLQLPVYAMDRAGNLQDAGDLMTEFLDQVFLRRVEWETAISHAISDADIERIVDCGPGVSARRFSRECMQPLSRRLRFESVQQFAHHAHEE
ncbi:hypothetical protein [Actinoplanes sp. TFC3]|uniref:hypothetical protein n=1 Tax=Actinoplanes sp. TFC3 TaxID=1710355 RepID=UPI000834019B|nr:hypothetical protein [Actinoplanes sp. TFC3]